MDSRFAPPRCGIFNVLYCRFQDDYNHLIVYSSTVSKDVPYGDSFTTDIIWDVQTSENNPNECHLEVTVWNAWQKRSFLSSVIDSETEKKMKPYFLQYIDEALDAAEKYADELAAKRSAGAAPVSGVSAASPTPAVGATGDAASPTGEAAEPPAAASRPPAAAQARKTRKPRASVTVAEEPAAASFFDLSLMQKLVLLALLVVVLLQVMLYWNISSLNGYHWYVEQQLVDVADRSEFLSKFIGYLAANLTGSSSPSLMQGEYEEWKQSSFREQLRSWGSELEQAKASLESSKVMVSELEAKLSSHLGEQERHEKIAQRSERIYA